MFGQFQPLASIVKTLRLEGTFLRNFTITFSGNSFAVLIGYLFTPFIARVYTPEAYGVFAFFISVTQNIGIVATLQLPRAFVLPEDEFEYRRILYASILSTGVVTTLTAIVLLVFGRFVSSNFGMEAEEAHLLIHLIPLSVLIYALNDILKSSNVRHKLFTKNAWAQTFSGVVSRSTTLLYGLLIAGKSFGLVLGDLIAKLSEIVWLGRNIASSPFSGLKSFRKEDFWRTLVRYRSYPLFVLPGFWVQSIIAQLPVYFALFYFGSASAGYYSFANSLLSIPVNMLAGAIAPVFLQKASETFRRDPGDMSRIVESLATKLFLSGFLPIAFMMVFADYVFTFVLGGQWVESGRIASYMGVYFLLSMLNYPLVSLYRIYGKEHLSLITNLLGLVFAIIALIVGALHRNFLLAIALFSVAGVTHYLVNIYLIFRIANVRPLKIFFRWAVYIVGAYSLAYILRQAMNIF